jgi:hypothetical protein
MLPALDTLIFSAMRFVKTCSLALKCEQFHDLQLIEAHHRLPVDDRHRRALKSLIDQLLHRRFIGANIFFDELNALLR